MAVLIVLHKNSVENARRVIIWLGKSHTSTPKLFRLMRLLRWTVRTENVAKRMTWGLNIKLTKALIKGGILWSKGELSVHSRQGAIANTCLGFGTNNSKLKEAFNYFVGNAWFTRVVNSHSHFYDFFSTCRKPYHHKISIRRYVSRHLLICSPL